MQKEKGTSKEESTNNVMAVSDKNPRRDKKSRTLLFPGNIFVSGAAKKVKNLAANKCIRIRDGLFFYSRNKKGVYSFLKKLVFTFLTALLGGMILDYIGVPAGAMVGSTLFVALASLKGMRVVTIPPMVFELMLVGVGIIVSANISPETVEVLASGKILLPVGISTLFIFLSSLLVSYIISRAVDWDFPTSFLAAAPGGFTVMTALAVTYGKDPFRVSMLHLSRLIALKMVIPLTFWFII